MKKTRGNTRAADACFWVCSILLFVLTYQVVTKQMTIEGADVTRHVNWALEMNFTKELLPFIPYPLFHILVKGIVRLFAIPKSVTAAMIIGITNVVSFVFVYRYLQDGILKKSQITEERAACLAAPAALLLLLVQAFYIPAFNDKLYLGQGAINIWHNPTYMIVRPFGILAFFVVIRLLEEQRENRKAAFTREWWMLLVVMIFANIAKPSFSQVFIPGLGLYMVLDIIRTKGKSFFYHFQIACAFIPATILLFLQASASLSAGVCFEWMEVWNSYTKSPWISILLLMAFPVYVILTDVKGFFAGIDRRLSAFIWLAGFCEAAVLAEDSARKYSGNFFWGYYLGALFLWLSAFRYFMEQACENKGTAGRVKTAAGCVLLLLHLISGIYYLYRLILVPGFWY